MKNRSLYLFLALAISCFAACSRPNDPTPAPGPTEEKLAIKLSASGVEVSPSNSFPLTVTVTSKMPTGGVIIKVDAKREDNNASVLSITSPATSVAGTNFTISPLPANQVYVTVTVLVTSVTTASNTATASFRVVWK